MTVSRTLDRIVKFDDRSRNYPVTAVLSVDGLESNWWSILPAKLDQGSEGACVGFGFANCLISEPPYNRDKSINNDYAMSIYNEAKRQDEWAGENYDGTSVLAGAKVLKQRDRITEYRWAFGLDDVLATLSGFGTVVLGVNWYEGMFDPDSNGFIHPTGQVAGGHCILARGLSITHERVLLKNSWGWDWGDWGGCSISFTDLDRLLNEDGEACVPVKPGQ